MGKVRHIMGHIQFGLIVPDTALDAPRRHVYMENLHRLLNAVKGHYVSAWSIDHLQGDVLEGWTALAYLSALHPELVWGHTVLCQSFRNPALVAKMGATLQFLSGGRFVLGIGAGGQAAEYRAYGYDFPPGRTRVAELNEALHIIKALWTEPYATYEGKYYQVRGAINEPKGVQKPHPPLWIGGGGEKVTLKLVARYGDACNVGGWDPEVYRHKYSVLQQHCTDLGRDYTRIIKSSEVFLYLTDTPDNIEGAIAHLPPAVQAEIRSRFLIATPATAIARLQTLVDAGAEYFIVYLLNSARLEPLQRFAREVVPAFAGAVPGPAATR